MRRMRSRLRRVAAKLLLGERGQAATEYMMVISVIVIAMVAASRPFVGSHGPFQTAMKQLSRNIGSSIAAPDSELLPRR